MGRLLRRYRAATLEASALRGDPLLADHLQALIQLSGDDANLPDAVDDAGPTTLAATSEPLTRQEVRVLQLLAEGYSNGAMASKLFISDSTVRTHLRNINAKLGARNRTQAVAYARRLGVMA